MCCSEVVHRVQLIVAFRVVRAPRAFFWARPAEKMSLGASARDGKRGERDFLIVLSTRTSTSRTRGHRIEEAGLRARYDATGSGLTPRLVPTVAVLIKFYSILYSILGVARPERPGLDLE